MDGEVRMQLSPSTLTSTADPSLLALLFPAATPPASGSTTAAPASTLPLGEGGFENIFSALAPVAVSPAAARGTTLTTETKGAPVVLAESATTAANPSLVASLQARTFAPAPSRGSTPGSASTAGSIVAPAVVTDGESQSPAPAKTGSPLGRRFSEGGHARLTTFTELAETRGSESAIPMGAEVPAMAFQTALLPSAPVTPPTEAVPETETPAGTPQAFGTPRANRSPNSEGAPIDRTRPEAAFALRDDVTSARQLDSTRAPSSETPRQTSAPVAAGNNPTTATPLAGADSARVRPSVTDDASPDAAALVPDEASATMLESPLELRSTSTAGGRERVEMPQLAGDVRAPKTLPIADKANFADAPHRTHDSKESEDFSSDKSFVTTPEEPLTPRGRRLGTSVANSAPVMPISVSTTPSPHPAFEYAGAPSGVAETVMPSTFAGELSPTMPTPAVQAVSGAHQAVEAVLHAVETAAGREQTSVKLDFSVGDAELSVRVELHAEEVRTTFLTESTELRNALTQEWHAVNSGAGERGVRLAPPVFTTSEPSGSDAFAGDSASQRHDRNPARRDDGDASTTPAFARPGSFDAQSAASAGASHLSSLSPLAPSGTARRLNFFA